MSKAIKGEQREFCDDGTVEYFAYDSDYPRTHVIQELYKGA